MRVKANLGIGLFWAIFSAIMTILSIGGIASALEGWREIFYSIEKFIANELYFLVPFSIFIKSIVSAYTALLQYLFPFLPAGLREMCVLWIAIISPLFTGKLTNGNFRISKLESRFVIFAVSAVLISSVHELTWGQTDASLAIFFPVFLPLMLYILFFGVIDFVGLIFLEPFNIDDAFKRNFGWIMFVVFQVLIVVGLMALSGSGFSRDSNIPKPNLDNALTGFVMCSIVVLIFVVRRIGNSRTAKYQ